MDHFRFDWQTIFQLDVPLLETTVRGNVIYLAVSFLPQLALHRTAGELTKLDVVFVLLAASAGADAMLGGSISVSMQWG